MKKQWEILYEDDWLLVVNKPPDLLSIPDRYDSMRPNLLDLLKNEREAVFTIHRLDRQTSGLMIFAKDKQTHRLLSLQFQERRVKKIYWALVQGRPSPSEGTIEAAIASGGSHRMMVSPKGKKAITYYRTLENFRGYTLVEAIPLTGRTHQIRVHLAFAGFPLITDPLYGASEALFLSQFKTRKYRRSQGKEERPLLSRSALHAREIRFLHPVEQDQRSFNAALPKDFHATLKQLRKWATVNNE